MPKLDYLGRTTIPKDIRDQLNIEPEDRLDFELKDNCIIITPHIKKCKLCGIRTSDKYHGLTICKDCLRVLMNAE